MKRIIEPECEGCSKILKPNVCLAYIDPALFKRDNGMFMCPIKGYAELVASTQTKVIRVGQQKQKKKGR